MKYKTFFNSCYSIALLSIFLLSLVAVLPQNTMAQASQTSRITVDKAVCDSIGQQNTCNGRINNLEGQTITFSVFDATGTPPMTPSGQLTFVNNINVVIGPQGNGSQGSTTTDNIYVTGREYLVCEAVPAGYDTLPRPDQSTGGSTQSREGDCIRFTAVSGNNVLQFINYLEDIDPTSAHATISGRVLDPRGRAVPRARVIVTDSNGFTRTALTNFSGFYRFSDLPTGEIYIIGGFDKRYVFTPLVINLMEDVGNQTLRVQ